MDSVQFLKCISFFSSDQIIIYWNKLYDLRNLVEMPVWFYWTRVFDRLYFCYGNLLFHIDYQYLCNNAGHLCNSNINICR